MNSCIEHGIKDPEKNVVWYSSAEKKELFTNSKARILELLGKVTAVVCYNDLLAANLLRFCRENAISVPDEISVTGIDDSSYAELSGVGLTTVRHPHRSLGEAAAKLLLRLMDKDEPEPEDIIFTPELIIRGSVKTLSGAEVS